MKASHLSILFLFLVIRCTASTIEITTTKVPNGTVDDAYSATIKAAGGCTPYKWKVASGKLPTGVIDKASANAINLDLSGTPTEADSYSFTISVTDCGGHVAKESYSVTVQKAAEHVVSLAWDASRSKNLAGYNVYRGPDGVKWTKINAGLVAATDYGDSTVSNGDTLLRCDVSQHRGGGEPENQVGEGFCPGLAWLGGIWNPVSKQPVAWGFIMCSLNKYGALRGEPSSLAAGIRICLHFSLDIHRPCTAD